MCKRLIKKQHAKKSDAKSYISYDSIYVTILEKTKRISGYQGLGMEGEDWLQRLIRTFWGDGNVLYLDWSGSNATICICPNSLNYILLKGLILLYVNYTSINLTFNSTGIGIREAWTQIRALSLTSNMKTCASVFFPKNLTGLMWSLQNTF